MVRCVAIDVSAIFDQMLFLHWFNGGNIRDLGRVFRVRDRPVYLQEVSLSRVNPIL